MISKHIQISLTSKVSYFMDYSVIFDQSRSRDKNEWWIHLFTSFSECISKPRYILDGSTLRYILIILYHVFRSILNVNHPRHFQDRSNRSHLLPLGQTLDSPLETISPTCRPTLAQPNVLYQKV